MRNWLICLVEILVYTFGVAGVCAYLTECTHRATFALLGRRAGRFFWYATALPGAPVHELGHALFCLLFAHRIERIRLLPDHRGAACVDHSYTRRNPYAALGCVPIALGPIFSCLLVMLLVLRGLFPDALAVYSGTLEGLRENTGLPPAEVLRCGWGIIRALFSDHSYPVLVRISGIYLLLSMSLHVRLSVADLRSMAPGFPWVVLLSALIAAIIALTGEAALVATTAALQAFALLQCALFALILLFSLICLVLAAACRLILNCV